MEPVLNYFKQAARIHLPFSLGSKLIPYSLNRKNVSGGKDYWDLWVSSRTSLIMYRIPNKMSQVQHVRWQVGVPVGFGLS